MFRLPREGVANNNNEEIIVEKIWLKNYPKGTPVEIDYSRYESLVDLYQQSVKKYAANIAYTNVRHSLTYKALDVLVTNFAAYLQSKLGLKKGQRLAIMLPNCLQYPVALFAALRAGLVVVNVNPLYTARELEHQLKDSGADAIVIMANFAHTLEQVVARTAVKHIFVTELGDLLPFPKSLMINFIMKHVKKMVPQWHLPNHIPLKSAIHEGKSLTFNPVEIMRNDIAFLQYTGGTTGVAKGAVLTHGNMIANVMQSAAWFEGLVDVGKEIVLTPLPLYHIFSLTANLFVFMHFGGQCFLITNPRDTDRFVKEISRIKFTGITAVNTLFNALINHPDFAKIDFSSMRLALGGGMSVQKAVAQRWKAITGVPILEAYGLTETCPAVTINPPEIEDYNGTIGLPIPSTEICIRDEEGIELPVGEAGELWVRGPQVMQGYWNRPEETAKVLTVDGWLKTGDVAKVDQEGFVSIVDRKKDMIIVSGFNVYPNEVEDVIACHAGVLEVAAIGVPDEKSGEAVKVFIVKKDPSLTKEEIIKYCRENLTGYKVPKFVEFKDELPKTMVGKILRRELRDETMAAK